MTRRRLGTLLKLVALAASAALALWVAFVAAPNHPYFANDSHAYWAVQVETMYANGLAPNIDAFLYTSPIGLVASTFGVVPFETFLAVWQSVQVALLVAMTGPFAGPLAVTPLVGTELAVGNISLIMAAAVVIGFRYPAAWALVLLTKVTPGVGLLWFAVRREWRSLFIALGVTAAIAGVSFVFFPGLWAEWFDLMLRSVRQPAPDTAAAVPFVVRLALAVVVIVAGAVTDRPWVVPIAVMLGHAHLWSSVGALLVACIPLAFAPWLALRPGRRWGRTGAGREPAPDVA